MLRTVKVTLEEFHMIVRRASYDCYGPHLSGTLSVLLSLVSHSLLKVLCLVSTLSVPPEITSDLLCVVKPEDHFSVLILGTFNIILINIFLWEVDGCIIQKWCTVVHRVTYRVLLVLQIKCESLLLCIEDLKILRCAECARTLGCPLPKSIQSLVPYGF